MHLSAAKNLSFLPGLTQSCCYTDHHNTGDNIKNLCTLYPSHENETAHVIWHVLRAMIRPLKGIITNMKTVIHPPKRYMCTTHSKLLCQEAEVRHFPFDFYYHPVMLLFLIRQYTVYFYCQFTAFLILNFNFLVHPYFFKNLTQAASKISFLRKAVLLSSFYIYY